MRFNAQYDALIKLYFRGVSLRFSTKPIFACLIIIDFSCWLKFTEDVIACKPNTWGHCHYLQESTSFIYIIYLLFEVKTLMYSTLYDRRALFAINITFIIVFVHR